ncbi:regulatory protein RecX [Nocardioides sp. SYSU D00038]|uniref:regulatory protein RecX n=1 Tax=Nocardioides sp. SYSU D00038 TaxID=2812554 RepID=UPI0027DC65F3|nr:regulatory protein RecX [Nocardioides sp. SYSU D00038]
MRDEERPAPDWVGDVSVGVDAWTHRADTPAGDGSPDGSATGEPRRASRPRSRWPSPPPADTVAAGPEADPESVARTILLDQLAGRARSRRELADKLASRNVPADVATRLLDRFEEVGLVDDAQFARSWVDQRGATAARGLASRALAQELRRKGVADEVTREVLDEVDPAAEETAARALVRKKLRGLAGVDDVAATRRLVGMLARKGYSTGLAFSVVREELAAAGRDAPEPD